MAESRNCDICRKQMAEPTRSLLRGDDLPTVAYRLERTDTSGYGDALDICSAECLAAAAVGEGHERGGREERRASLLRRQQQHPEPKRRWWQR